MIKKLDNSNAEAAEQIYIVFQDSYKIEAQFIGVSFCHFPPLSRRIEDIKSAETLFYGYFVNGQLVGVIEVSTKQTQLKINSLTVHPAFFKQGIAGKMISYVLTAFDCNQAIVETAVANTPAINLYKKVGFVEFKQWVPSHGIPKVAMSKPL